MRGKDLLECMEQIDDALVEEALEPDAFLRTNIAAKWRRFSASFLMGGAARRENKVVKWGVAACVVVLGASASAFWAHKSMKENGMENQDKDTTSLQMAVDATAANDAGSAGGSMVSDTHNGAVTAGAGGNASEGAVSGGVEADRECSAEDAAAAKDSMVETAQLEEELKKQVTESLSYTVISDYYDEKDGSVYDYPVPEKGQFFCYHYLQETMKYYAVLENESITTDSSVNISENTSSPVYVYDVVIHVYGDVEKDGEIIFCGLENTDSGSEKIEQEYRRLIDLGYAVRLSEDFQLTGTFTKAELDTFQASPEYGYTFRFASEY